MPDDDRCLYSKEPTPENTPDLGVEFCPLCEPERDLYERRADGKVWVSKLCAIHGYPKGDADGQTSVTQDLSFYATGQAEGNVSNRAACEIVHGEGRARQASPSAPQQTNEAG